MKKIINRLINENVKNVDVYSINGCLWFIFTDTKKWIIEIDNEGTLYYQYDFFKNLFNYVNLDVTIGGNYVTAWFKECALKNWEIFNLGKEDGVKHTYWSDNEMAFSVERTIQNGVKHTLFGRYQQLQEVERTIQNGVKHTRASSLENQSTVECAMQNGVKHTLEMSLEEVECVIQNGFKLQHN